MDSTAFYNKIKIGDQIPPLERIAVTHNKLPRIFGDIKLENESEASQKKAAGLGVDAIHTTRLFGGVYSLHFISEMITGWIPDPKGWIEGGSLSSKFVKVIPVGEWIICKGQVKDKQTLDNKNYLICDFWVEKENGEKAVVGEARIAFSG